MSKDALPAEANQAGAGVTGDTARVKACMFVVAWGGVLGLAVGVLNLVAIAHGWALRDYFDVLDSPVSTLMEPYPAFYYGLWIPGNTYGPGTLRAILIYWIVIGWFLGWIFCLARAGVIRAIACEKVCRWVLFAGACGGMVIGSLGFLASSSGWEELGSLFEGFNGPVYRLMDVLKVRYHVLDSLPHGPATEFVCLHVAGIVYWMMIGLFLASQYCIVRMLGKRATARENRMSE